MMQGKKRMIFQSNEIGVSPGHSSIGLVKLAKIRIQVDSVDHYQLTASPREPNAAAPATGARFHPRFPILGFRIIPEFSN